MADKSALKATIYDQFEDYVSRSVKDESNPDISLQAFDKLREPGPTHVSIALQNAKPTKELFEAIEKFRPGTKVDTEEHIPTGGHVLVAHIPWRTRGGGAGVGKRGVSWGGSYDSSGAPDSRILYAYLGLMMLTVGVALFKTSWSDWRFLFG